MGVALSICIPTYRNCELLTRCMSAIHEGTYADYELLVLDNGSHPRGFTWTANRLLAAAEGDYLVVVNHDVVVEPGWWAPLRIALGQDEGLWACSPSSPDDDNWDLNVWCCAFTRASYERLEGFSPRYIHWQSDADLMQRIKDGGGRYSRPEGSFARHLRAPPPDEKMLSQMRTWHVHDFGTEAGW